MLYNTFYRLILVFTAVLGHSHPLRKSGQWLWPKTALLNKAMIERDRDRMPTAKRLLFFMATKARL